MLRKKKQPTLHNVKCLKINSIIKTQHKHFDTNMKTIKLSTNRINKILAKHQRNIKK